MARSKHGEGSLRLEIDEIGLKYTFEAPNTALGDELLEGLRRGDINTSSFAFTVGSDNWSKREDGTYLRTINSISELFDVSPVYRAAYDATSVKVDARGLDTFRKQEEEKAQLEYLLKRSQEVEKELNKEEEKPTDEDEVKPTDEAPTDKQDEEPTENPKDDEEQKANDESTKEDDKEDEEDNNTLNDNKLNKRTMEKFSLLKAINSIANNKQLDERSAEVVNAGVAEMRKSGLSYNGQIQLPIEERADV